jgi:two-component system KDP operon response regulator KdpE
MLTLTGREHADHVRTEGACILSVEDDKQIAKMLDWTLAGQGYRVLSATTGKQAIEEVRTRNPDLVLLDLGLPDADGIAVLIDIRANTEAPIIVVSADTLERDKVKALDAGANDYLTKPFSTPELMARIRAGLRSRSHIEGSNQKTLSFGDYQLDLEGRQLTRKGKPVHLSATEFKLLATLARHADEVVAPDAILREAWGSAYKSGHQGQGKDGYIRVYMHALRQKIEKDPTRPRWLVNEIGLGYRLRTSGTESARAPRAAAS